MAVKIVPTSTPSTGLENSTSTRVNSGTSLSPPTAADIASMPNISTAKPIRIMPVSLRLALFWNIYRTIPIIAKIGTKDDGLSS